jgi:hypothetical protein
MSVLYVHTRLDAWTAESCIRHGVLEFGCAAPEPPAFDVVGDSQLDFDRSPHPGFSAYSFIYDRVNHSCRRFEQGQGTTFGSCLAFREEATDSIWGLVAIGHTASSE